MTGVVGARRVWSSSVRALITALVVGAAACAPSPPPQDAWVWRRQWTPALSASVALAPASLARLRVLAVEHERQGDALRAVVVDVDEAALAVAGRPVLATWRVGGATPPTANRLDDVLPVIGRWRAAGVDVVGLELDHDCATSRLGDYRALLLGLRARLPKDLGLAITALPAWRDDPVGLRGVSSVVDEVTVQVHAVAAPRLFDPATAVDEAVAFARAVGRDVGVALPTYAARTRDGPLLKVEASEVVDVARRLRRAPGIARLSFFRLGATDDPGAFSHATLGAVLAGDDVVADVVVEMVTAADGAVDVDLVNRGTGPGRAPARIAIPGSAIAVEAAPGVVIDGGAWLPGDVHIPAAARRRLGWWRPATPGPSSAHLESL